MREAEALKDEVSDFTSSDSRKGELKGTLYVVATPIGNLDDLSPRAARTLASVDVVAAEDTRHSGRLLSHLGIQKRMVALHDHNEKDRAAGILTELQAGRDVALISDAGTPLISDPGYVLVREARAAGHRVSPIPGPCALVAALSVAGLPTDRFLYVGFLPAKRSGRRASLEVLSSEVATLVFYESPHRIMESVRDIADVLGSDREIVLGREITKTFETFYSGSVADVLAELERDPHGNRGEFVVMVRGAAAQAGSEEAATMDVDRMLRVLLAELPVKKVAKMASELTGLSKNELYQRALALKDG
ncbi:16S rRNA (cytidine(1402)-2'-O)-methyltransferase [Marinobacter salsuginis]|jgi:16S rRNA (cytidine1402-2'-O)-methyltransferase|uniref:16S rRNA (cytidine(1402)-2'-O)-methyltransferase n=1 Tax=Marinobacter salsuginis TaxID=418719 RepID=UPI001AE069C0|nr:16S rRNA (cytidine(1402)-2'-O)-methyltransferase [Marinobacter salsuginis]